MALDFEIVAPVAGGTCSHGSAPVPGKHVQHQDSMFCINA
jgi:hypothetical protein